MSDNTVVGPVPCTACTGRFVSTATVSDSCFECPTGKVANDAHIWPCVGCLAPTYAGAMDNACQFCSPGEMPHDIDDDGYSDLCAGCHASMSEFMIEGNPEHHSPDGETCVGCPGSGSGEIADGSAASCRCPGMVWDTNAHLSDGGSVAESARFESGSYNYEPGFNWTTFSHENGNAKGVQVFTYTGDLLSADASVAACLDSQNSPIIDASCCQPCPSGLSNASDPTSTAMNCSDGDNPTINAGVWRREGGSGMRLFFCPNPDACTGQQAGDAGCAYGYRGPLCAQCIPMWAKYSANSCVECPDSQFVKLLLGFLVGFFAIGAMGFMVRKNNSSIAPPTVEDVLAGEID